MIQMLFEFVGEWCLLRRLEVLEVDGSDTAIAVFAISDPEEETPTSKSDLRNCHQTAIGGEYL